MAMDILSKASAAFKILFGRSHTANANELFNEAEPAFVQLAATQVFGEEIPATASNSALTEFVEAELILIATSGGKAYQAYYPTGHARQGEKIRNVVSQSYGDSYRPILKDNGTEVPPLASQDWFLTPSSGIVVSEDNLNLGSTGTLECYVYQGKMVQEQLSDLSSQVDSFQPGVLYDCEDDVEAGDLVGFTAARKVGRVDISQEHEALGIALAPTGSAGAKTCLVLADDNEIDISTVVGGAFGDKLYWHGAGTVGLAMPTGSGERVWQMGVLSDDSHLHVQIKFVKRNPV